MGTYAHFCGYMLNSVLNARRHCIMIIFIQSILFMELAIALETSVDEIFDEITRLLDIHDQPTIQSL